MSDARYKVTQQDIYEMRRLRKQGLSYQKIANRIGNISYATVLYWCDDKQREKQRAKLDSGDLNTMNGKMED